MTGTGIDQRLPSPGAELARLGEAYFATQHSYDPYNATLLGINEFTVAAHAITPQETAGPHAGRRYSDTNDEHFH